MHYKIIFEFKKAVVKLGLQSESKSYNIGVNSYNSEGFNELYVSN